MIPCSRDKVLNALLLSMRYQDPYAPRGQKSFISWLLFYVNVVRLGLRSQVLWVLLNPPALPVPHCISEGSAAGNKSPRESWNLELSSKAFRTWPGRAKFDLHLAISLCWEEGGSRWQLQISSSLCIFLSAPQLLQVPDKCWGVVGLTQHSSPSYPRWWSVLQGLQKWGCGRRSQCLRHLCKFPSSPCTWVPSHNKWARGLGCDVLLDIGLKWYWGHGWRIWVDWGDAASSMPHCLEELLILAEFCHNKFFFSNKLIGEIGHHKWVQCWREV